MLSLVSIITPTWNRHKELVECAKRVREQTYPNLEHVIISDGLDEDLLYEVSPKINERYVDIVPLELAWNTSSTLHNSFGIAPLLTGMLMASGQYQIWLSDDDHMDKDYISCLVQLIEKEDVDFVYSKCWFYWYDQVISDGYVIGTDPPQHGQITNFLYKKSLLFKEGCMPVFGTHPVDINIVKQWLNAGATYKMLDEVKFYHKADQR